MEHRCGFRYATDVAVVISTSSGLIGQGILRQMSASGALIQSSLLVRAELTVHVRFVFKGRRNNPLQAGMAGEVVRCTEGGFAVEWVEFAADATRALLESSRKRTLIGAGAAADASEVFIR